MVITKVILVMMMIMMMTMMIMVIKENRELFTGACHCKNPQHLEKAI